MDASNLRYFLKIAELRSINRASDALGIAQATLSQQLLRMEDEIGVKLFRRTTRGVILTEAGRIFQEHATRLLASWARALEDVRQFNHEPAGAVSFALPPSISRMVGVPLIQTVAEKTPQVSLRLIEALSGSIRPWLEAGTVDLGMLHDGGSLRHLSKRRIAREEMYLVGPPGKFGSSRNDLPSIPASDIAHYPLIMPSQQHGLKASLDREALKLGFTYTISHEIDAVSHIATLVSSGCGYSILPLPAVALELAKGQVSIARVGSGTMARDMCLARNPHQVITHASIVVEDAFLNIIIKLINEKQWDAVLYDGII